MSESRYTSSYTCAVVADVMVMPQETEPIATEIVLSSARSGNCRNTREEIPGCRYTVQ